eukprot:scaffold272718_cov23-Tisochrysis_lutea.AAC.1
MPPNFGAQEQQLEEGVKHATSQILRGSGSSALTAVMWRVPYGSHAHDGRGHKSSPCACPTLQVLCASKSNKKNGTVYPSSTLLRGCPIR